MIAKAVAAGADEVVLDLEDAVPRSEKAAARQVVASWLRSADEGEDRPGRLLPGSAPGARRADDSTGGVAPRVAVRVNALRTPWCHADIEACASARSPVLSLVLPKVESAGDLAFADRLLDGVEAAAGRAEPVALQALIETPAGLANVREIAAASPRLKTLIIGYADLAASLGRGPGLAPESWLWAQDTVLTAARTAGIAAVDGPHLGVRADEAFEASVRRAAQLGFDGKWVIHPRQIGAVISAFSPSSGQAADARRILAAYQRVVGRGAGAVEVEGQMVDEAVAAAARRVLASSGDAGNPATLTAGGGAGDD